MIHSAEMNPIAPPAQPLPPPRRWFAWLWLLGVSTVWSVAVVDFVLRDRWSGFAVLFYATPPIVVGSMSLILAGIGHRTAGQRRESAGALAVATLWLGVACVGCWIWGSFRWSPASTSPPARLKVVCWNVGRGHFATWDRIAEQLQRFDADVLALVEATADEVQSEEFWSTRLPDHLALPMQDGFVLLVKGTANLEAAGSLAKGGHFRRVNVTVHDSRCDIILADIFSNPLKPRDSALTKLFDIMPAQATKPTLVVGDFNTPPNSVWLDRWRIDWSNAWEVSGRGYQATWPQPLPVLPLDYVWGNRGVHFHRCHAGWSSCSDHRPLIVELTVNRD